MHAHVSVVTPVYNTEPYLEECILSVLNQTYQAFEYIIVDNCSTDNSLAIAERYAAADSRIRVVRNRQFLSQVQNYNAALAQIGAQSTYCKIVQADDWLFTRCLEEMVGLAESDPSIGIVSSYRLAGRQVKEVGLPLSARVVEGKALCRTQLVDEYHFFGSPSTVLFRSSIVRSRVPFYQEGRLHEDTEACYSILEAWKFGFVHQVLSFTRVDNESMMSKARRFNGHLLDRLIILDQFGRVYLNEAEFQACWRRHEKKYLRFLAEAALWPRGTEFWKYHVGGMATIDYRVSRAKMLGQIALVVLDILLNPKRTLGLAVAALRRRWDARIRPMAQSRHENAR